MARAENTVKTARKRTKSAKNTGFSKQTEDFLVFLKSEKARKILGIATILFSIFLLVAFISHFFSGNQDQSVVEGGILGNPGNDRPANLLGSVGAWLANRFIILGFGIPAMIIPFFTTLLGFAVLENKYFAFVWKTFKYVLFTILWGAAALTFFTYLFTGYGGWLGGGFGTFIYESLLPFIGAAGIGIIILLSLLVFVVLNFNTDFNLSALLPGKSKITEEVEKVDESITGTDSSGTESPDPIDPKDEKNKEPEILISVRPANEKNGKPKKEESGPGELVIVNAPADNTDKDLSISLNSGNIPAPPVADQLAGLELVIDDAIEDSSKEIISIDPTGDNIIKTEENTYEKFVPDEDKAVLKDGEDVGDWEEFDPTKELSDYQFPTLELLKAYDTGQTKEIDRAELEENKNKIVTTLKNYSIEITHIKATIGPTVTLYEIVPAPGIRISKIKNLEDDIALSLAALGIRIIAPIPGKGTIGIEIPNSNPEIVSMRSTLATEKFKDTKAELPIALGRTISNEVYIADLAKMPHVLIAGATGQGKSVGLNGLISSLLYKKHPAQIKFVLIDPKKVELNLYQALEKHFLAKLEGYDEPIITDTKQVIHVLNSLCKEMDNRYDLLKSAKVRNLKEYNEKFVNRRLNPKKGHRYMPYIVLIIDEFADLMMTAGKEIEVPIARLAQLARAIGIHLVLATQRPSVNVITGIIKANFPARISFRVTSKIDSRTILDTGGADQLIGRGDMLLSTGSDITRIQNAFIDTPEVERVVDFISNQRGYPESYYLPEVPIGDDDPDPGDVDLSNKDELFEDAARLVIQHQQGSTSLIQRRLKLGYNRAGRIIDQLEKAGIVGPFSGSKARDVLVMDEYGLEQILNDLD